MKTLSLILTMLSSFSGIVLGDGGIPVDRSSNKILVPHVMLTVSASQAEEIESLGTLTLSSEQWQELRTISAGCPKRIEEILPVTYHDCGCSLIDVFYGIQLSPTQVAVTHSEISGVSEKSDVKSALESGKDLILRMDGRGQLYYGGSLVPFGELLEMVSNSAKPDSNRLLGVVRPVGVKRDSAVAKERLGTLFKTAEIAGWEEWDLALDEN